MLVILFGMGLLSALLMNDPFAIIGTPLVLVLATRFRISPVLLLLTLEVAITTGILRQFYPKEFSYRLLKHDPVNPCDPRVTLPVRFSLALILLLAFANIVASLLGVPMVITLLLIALVGAAPVLLLSGQRWTVLLRIDWATLVFFAAMLVLMESVRQTGFFPVVC